MAATMADLKGLPRSRRPLDIGGDDRVVDGWADCRHVEAVSDFFSSTADGVLARELAAIAVERGETRKSDDLIAFEIKPRRWGRPALPNELGFRRIEGRDGLSRISSESSWSEARRFLAIPTLHRSEIFSGKICGLRSRKGWS